MFQLFATEKTAEFLQSHDVDVEPVDWPSAPTGGLANPLR